MPEHLANLVAFSTSGTDWAKFTGDRSVLELEQKEKDEKEMERKIEEAMKAAFAAEAKAKEDKERKERETAARIAER